MGAPLSELGDLVPSMEGWHAVVPGGEEEQFKFDGSRVGDLDELSFLFEELEKGSYDLGASLASGTGALDAQNTSAEATRQKDDRSAAVVADASNPLRLRLRVGDSDRSSQLAASKRSRPCSGTETPELELDGGYAGEESDAISDSSDTETDSDVAEGEVASFGTPTAKRCRVERRVRFCEAVKTHDGLCNENRILDALIWKYFSCPFFESTTHVAEVVGEDVHLYDSVIERIAGLASQIASTTGAVPVLPGGGGSAAKLSATHLPCLLALRELVVAARDTTRAPAVPQDLSDDGILVDVLGLDSDDCGVSYAN